MKPRVQRLTTMHARKVPVDVKAHFKAYCARRGYTLDAAVRELMIKAATENLRLPGASDTAVSRN
jgi:putative hemolysin